MKMQESRKEAAGAAAAVRSGDEAAFTQLAEQYRRELHVHCYRMLGSFHDAEDMVQETLLRAWRSRQSFEGRSSFRAWLYRIATNACLDFLERHRERVLPESAQSRQQPAPPVHVPWLQPFPDRLLEPVAPRTAEPDAQIATRENIELAFLVALQFLPAKQRAALILCDVLDWSAKEAAELLDTSVAALNGALQRARSTLRGHQPEQRAEWPAGLDADDAQRTLLQQYVAATERGDAEGLAALLREDARFSMPPEPAVSVGRDEIVRGWVEGGFGSASFGTFRCLITRVNRMPAVACYLRQPGDDVFRPLALDVLSIEEGRIAEVTAFPIDSLREALGLPATL